MNHFNKLVPLFIIMAIVALLPLQGCQAYDMYPVSGDAAPQTARYVEANPQQALDLIYEDIDIMGVNPLTKEILTDKFLVDTTNMQEVWGKYSDGRFGLSDVYIVKPVAGQEDSVRGILEDIKMLRTVEFRNYDIYNAKQIAEDGFVFETGGYVVLVMLEDNDSAVTIIEDYLKNN